MEGVNHEAIGLAGHLKLGRLIVLWDDNQHHHRRSTDLSTHEDVVARHQAAQWHTCECDGSMRTTSAGRSRKRSPTRAQSLIACKTIIGFGAPNKQGTAATHGAALGEDEVEAAREGLKLEPREFAVPDDVLTAWRAAGKRGAVDHAFVDRAAGRERAQDEYPARLNGKVERGLAHAISTAV